MAEEPVIYRNEVLTIMWLIGDLRNDLARVRAILEEDDGEEEDQELGNEN